MNKTLALLFILLLGCTAAKREISSINSAAEGFKKGLDNDIIYYILIDRFYDGNPDNNIPTWAFPSSYELKNKDKGASMILENQHYWLEKMFDWEKKKFQHYWGGDIQGVINKLPYLKKLGVTAIMISPINENVNGMFYNNGNAAYHGYWIKDWFRLEEHFANPPQGSETLTDALSGEKLIKHLTDLAHDMGMKILLDLSLNQTSPIQDDVNNFYYLEYAPILRDGEYLLSYCYPEITKEANPHPEESGYQYIYRYSKSCKETLDDSGWYNPPIAVHERDWANHNKVEHGQIGSMADLNQRNPEVKKYLLDSTIKWMNLGFDGFRVDGIKHLFKDFLLDFEQELAQLKPDVSLIGEYYDGGVFNQDSVDWLTSTEQYTMFDFALARNLRNYFRGDTSYKEHGSWGELNEILSRDEQGNYSSKNPLKDRSEHLVTFLNNHDMSRMMSMENANEDNYIAALKFILTARGVPALFYGDEIGLAVPHDRKYYNSFLKEIGADPWCRLMMSWEHLEEFSRDRLNSLVAQLRYMQLGQRYGAEVDKQEMGKIESEIARISKLLEKEEKIRSQQHIFQVTKKLISLRKQYDFLKDGQTKLLKPTKMLSGFFKKLPSLDPFGYTYLAMERISDDNQQMVYAFWSKHTQDYHYQVKLPDGIYQDAIEDNGKSYEVKDGIIHIPNMPAQKVIILAHGAPDPVEASQEFDVKIHVEVDQLKPGEKLYLVGSSEISGNWDLGKARGPFHRSAYNKFSYQFSVPADTEFEYKLVKIDGSGKSTWENGHNRIFFAYKNNQLIENIWNTLY